MTTIDRCWYILKFVNTFLIILGLEAILLEDFEIIIQSKKDTIQIGDKLEAKMN